MQFFFKPKGIAVVGASPGKGKGGNLIVSNMKRGYTGSIYPVNPRYEEIEDLSCYPSILDVPDPVDLAIVFVSARMVPQVIADCGQRGIPGAMIQSAGFSEIGDLGQSFQNDALSIAQKTGIRLWGPNCMGLVDAKSRYVFSTVTPTLWDTGLPAGEVSLIVQSGMLTGAFLIDLMSHGVTGISKVCSIGNKMDVNENDLLPYLMEDPDTGVIGLYLESFADPSRFVDLARSSKKPIVILSGGKTAKGAAAALSHTASLSASGAVVKGAMAQAGVAQADDFYQLTDYCRTLAIFPKPPGKGRNRVAVLTYTGAAGIVSVDLMDAHRLVPATLRSETLDTLQSVFPEWMPPSNPVDMWPGIIINGSKTAYRKAMGAVCADPDVDAVLAHCFVGGFDLEPDLLQMAEIAARSEKPLFCWISGERREVYEFQASAQQIGVPVFREIARAIECMDLVLNRMPAKGTGIPSTCESEYTESRDSTAKVLETEDGSVDEYAAKQILSQYGIPVVEEAVATSKAEALSIADRIGFPLVAKGMLPGVAHKTEANLVRLNITSNKDVQAVYEDLERTMQGKGKVLIQKQLEGKIELVAGFVKDPKFGPCVMCGLGGIFTEALNDTVFGVAPLNQKEALAMIDQLGCQDLLNGFRGIDPVDRDAVARILVSLGELGCSHSRIQEMDINPLVVHKGLPVAVDGLIVLTHPIKEEDV